MIGEKHVKPLVFIAVSYWKTMLLENLQWEKPIKMKFLTLNNCIFEKTDITLQTI